MTAATLDVQPRQQGESTATSVKDQSCDTLSSHVFDLSRHFYNFRRTSLDRRLLRADFLSLSSPSPVKTVSHHCLLDYLILYRRASIPRAEKLSSPLLLFEPSELSERPAHRYTKHRDTAKSNVDEETAAPRREFLESLSQGPLTSLACFLGRMRQLGAS